MTNHKNNIERQPDNIAVIPKPNSGRTIPVVMSFDSDYYFPTCVTVLSVMEHAAPEDRYCFFFLIGGEASDVDKGVFSAVAEKYPNFCWQYISVNTDLFAETRRTVEHVSAATYYRLLIPELISGYDRCIYLDSDMIVFGDITDILDACDMAEGIPFSQCCIGAVMDMLLQLKDVPWRKKHLDILHFEDSRDYFNAGMLVLNLEKLRADRMVDTFLSLVKNKYYFADQDILNIACAGKVMYLPARYNLVSYYIGNRYVAECADLHGEDWQDVMEGHPFVCHFAGSNKPWKQVETVWEYSWYETAKRLPHTEYVKEQLSLLEKNRTDRLRENLFPAARRAGELILYGFSAAGFRLCSHMLAEGFTNIRCFCDRDPSKVGLAYMGIQCLGRDILSELPGDAMVIICPQKSWREIIRDLNETGVDSNKLVRFRTRDTRIVSID